MAECPGIHVLAEVADGLLARVRIPGGRLSAVQARGLAAAARTLGSGLIDLTRRANLQLRGLSQATAPRLPDRLEAIGLSASPSVDRRRNIIADPLAGLDPHEILDPSCLVVQLDRALCGCSELCGLSPKFSFALDGGGRSGTIGVVSDLGLRAERGDKTVLRLFLAGGATPFGIAPERAVPALLEITRATARLGPRARARDLLARDGGAGLVILTGTAPWRLPPPRETPEPWPMLGSFRQKQERRVAVGLAAPTGILSAEQLSAVADLADHFGDGSIRLTPCRTILFPNVPESRADALSAAASVLVRATELTAR